MYPAKKNVSKEGENNSQFMTRESEARSCAQKRAMLLSETVS